MEDLRSYVVEHGACHRAIDSDPSDKQAEEQSFDLYDVMFPVYYPVLDKKGKTQTDENGFTVERHETKQEKYNRLELAAKWCGECGVREECAIIGTNEIVGVWGGVDHVGKKRESILPFPKNNPMRNPDGTLVTYEKGKKKVLPAPKGYDPESHSIKN